MSHEESQVSKNHEWHRAILQAAMDGFWMVDMQGRLLEVNAAYCRMIGYSEAELLTMSIADLEVIETAEVIAARIVRIKELGGDRFETRHRRKDGTIIDLEVSTQYQPFGGGRTIAFLRDITDVTGRKEVELALQQEQRLYADLVTTLPAGAYRLRVMNIGDWQGKTWRAMAGKLYSLDFASDRFCSILGLSHDALAADPGVVSDVVHPEERENFDALNAQAMTDFNPFVWEGRILHQEQTRWVHFESVPRRIDPQTVLWTGIVYDISELKQSLKEREQFYKFFQTSADLMCLADPHGCFLKTNRAFTETLGYSEAELLARPFIEFVHPDDREATLYELVVQLQRGYTNNFHNRYLCKDGSVKWLSWRVSFDKDDGIAYATARDVTAKKKMETALRENEERMTLALQAGNMGLYDLDVQSGKAVVNAEYALMLGYNPSDFYETNEKWIERLHPDDREPVAAVYQAYVRGEIPEYKVEFRQKTRDGNWKWILTYGRIMKRAADGTPLRMLGVHVDISERKEAEEALREGKEQLRVIFDASQAGIILVSPQGEILFANSRMAELFGMPLEKLIGSPYAEHLHPSESKTGDERMQQLLRGEIQSVAHAHHYRREDGTDFWGFLSG
ncbi:MAG: PAS domain S-box protein, partial [Desulfuromonadales bacterium]|nr:PAS domain S-box protein [Desulfuromonadales bacterium]